MIFVEALALKQDFPSHGKIFHGALCKWLKNTPMLPETEVPTDVGPQIVDQCWLLQT